MTTPQKKDMSMKNYSFSYRGFIESSKSLVNRGLILKYLHPELKLIYKSRAQDILVLERALLGLRQGQSEFHLGNSGSGFRFFSILLTALKGSWKIKVSSQLAQRPHEDFLSLSEQLGVNRTWEKDTLIIDSQGWKPSVSRIEVDLKRTSQFLSGLYLVATSYHSSLEISKLNAKNSSGYDQMTQSFIKSLKGQFNGDKAIGADWSSLIYLLSFCFLGAQIEVFNVDFSSPEPDLRGLKVLEFFGFKVGYF